jgi:hypothetical protein
LHSRDRRHGQEVGLVLRKVELISETLHRSGPRRIGLGRLECDSHR